MQRISTTLLLATHAIILCGCASLQSDYVAASSGATATIEVTNIEGTINRRVLVHGTDICSAPQARLVGLLRSKTLGIPHKDLLTLPVEANKPVAISSPWSKVVDVDNIKITKRYCQPVVAFTPVEGSLYQIDFAACTASVVETRLNAPVRITSTLHQGCKLQMNLHDPRMFFLVPEK